MTRSKPLQKSTMMNHGKKEWCTMVYRDTNLNNWNR
jgi:hypothetical protein